MSADPNAPTVDDNADLFAGLKKKKKGSKKADLASLDLDAPAAAPAEEAALVAEPAPAAAPADDGELDFSDLKKKKKKKVSIQFGGRNGRVRVRLVVAAASGDRRGAHLALSRTDCSVINTN